MCNTTKTNYSVQSTYKPTHVTPFNSTLSITSVKLHTTTKLPLLVKNVFMLTVNLLRLPSVSNPG